jgi:pimeloyl-ACP methyl ester carboxylesterase
MRRLLLFAVCLLNGVAWAGGGARVAPVARVVKGLRAGGVRVDVEERRADSELRWVEADVYAGESEHPITVNILAMHRPEAVRVMYLLTTSSLNFRGSFFTPAEKGLAYYLASRGYLVVGITPREDNVEPGDDLSVMADWGMKQHRDDVRTIIERVQSVVGLPYDVLGHSFGAIVALDYAGHYSEDDFERVMVLDVPSFDPDTQPLMIAYAQLSLGAYDDLLASGEYVETSLFELRLLLGANAMYPDVDSGVPRAFLGLPGNFTYAGLLHFSLINTAFMPGVIFPLTGLPQEWPMVLGNAAGYYEFALDPLKDEFGLLHVDVNRLLAVAGVMGSGYAPVALARDYTSAIADQKLYSVDWAGIDEKVVWINAELGMGEQTHGATHIEEAGNEDVQVHVIPGYGHADVILGENAAEDVWGLLLPQPDSWESQYQWWQYWQGYSAYRR